MNKKCAGSAFDVACMTVETIVFGREGGKSVCVEECVCVCVCE